MGVSSNQSLVIHTWGAEGLGVSGLASVTQVGHGLEPG